ncbi:MAG: alanine racemase [Oscillospiraceae bacterium]
MKRYLVDSAAIRQNLETLKKRAGKARLFAVVKGNGYGLGLVPLAAICRDAGVDTFCVTEVSDAKQLRDAGFTQDILMIRPTCDVDEVHQLLDLRVILTVSSPDDAAVLNGIATQRKQRIRAHVEIDTGMGRYGFLPSELDKLIHLYSYMDGLELCGIYTHFHSAFCNKKATDLQMVAFRSVIRQLQEKGFDVGVCHCCNSAGLLRFPNYAMDAVRVGSAILGRLSFKGSYNLKRVGTLEATVDELRWLPKGHTCGYGAGWKAKKPTRIAVLPVGWYNGFGCQMGNDLTRRRDSLRRRAFKPQAVAPWPQGLYRPARHEALQGPRSYRHAPHRHRRDKRQLQARRQSDFRREPAPAQGRGRHVPINHKSLGQPSRGFL